MDEDEIRRDERRKVAGLLEEHAATLSSFTGDSTRVVKLIALMLRLPAGWDDQS